MALTLSGTNGVVGAGFTVDNSGVSVTAGVGTFGSIGAGTSVAAAGLHGTMPTIDGSALTSINAAQLVGVATAGFERTGNFGKIVKTSYVSTASFTDGTSTSYFDISNLTVNHTPLSSSNTLHIVAHIQNLVIKTSGYEGSIGLNILQDSTEIAAIELRSKDYGQSGMRNCTTGIIDAQVTAGTTSQITFKCQCKMISGNLVSINPGNEGGGTDSDQSSITIFEIAS